MKTNKSTKSKIHKLIKSDIRKDFIKQGGLDGRFKEKVIPNKKKQYKRNKKIEED
jgi:hypothetical protein